MACPLECCVCCCRYPICCSMPCPQAWLLIIVRNLNGCDILFRVFLSQISWQASCYRKKNVVSEIHHESLQVTQTGCPRPCYCCLLKLCNALSTVKPSIDTAVQLLDFPIVSYISAWLYNFCIVLGISKIMFEEWEWVIASQFS